MKSEIIISNLCGGQWPRGSAAPGRCRYGSYGVGGFGGGGGSEADVRHKKFHPIKNLKTDILYLIAARLCKRSKLKNLELVYC